MVMPPDCDGGTPHYSRTASAAFARAAMSLYAGSMSDTIPTHPTSIMIASIARVSLRLRFVARPHYYTRSSIPIKCREKFLLGNLPPSRIVH